MKGRSKMSKNDDMKWVILSTHDGFYNGSVAYYDSKESALQSVSEDILSDITH